MDAIKEKEHAHELIERLEPSRMEDAVRVLESLVAKKTNGDNGAPKRLSYRHEEMQWLNTHQDELAAHRGKWVLLEGSKLLAVDADHDIVWEQAKAVGIKRPLIFRVPPDDLPFAGF